MKAKKSNATNESCLELKYCERCGGLWLRPSGGSQVYCAACGREMAQLPPASHEPGHPRVPQGPRWYGDDGDFYDYEGDEGLNLDASGGVA